MHHGDQKLFEKRADLSAIYPENVLWMVTAGTVRRIIVKSTLYMHPVACRNTYRFNYFCKEGDPSGAAFADDYGLGKRSNGGNCLFYDKEDADAYAESIKQRHRCVYCGREIE